MIKIKYSIINNIRIIVINIYIIIIIIVIIINNYSRSRYDYIRLQRLYVANIRTVIIQS